MSMQERERTQPTTESQKLSSLPEKKLHGRRYQKLFYKVAGLLLGITLSLAAPEAVQANEDETSVDSIVMVAPDLERQGVELLLGELAEVRETSPESDLTPEVLVLGDSLGTAQSFLEASEDTDLHVVNWSAQGARFGSYGALENSPQQALIGNQELLQRLDSLEDKPEFVLFFLGRNDCRFINTSTALNHLQTRQETGSFPSGTGFTLQWLQESLELIEQLKSRGIVPIMTTSTPIVSEGYCDLNNQHINVVFSRIAEIERIPLLVPSQTEYVTRRTTYPPHLRSRRCNRDYGSLSGWDTYSNEYVWKLEQLFTAVFRSHQQSDTT